LAIRIMKTFYERRETAEEIEFQFKYLPLANLLFFLAIGASLAPCGRLANRTLRICGVLLLLYIIGILPVWMDLEKAMRSGSVLVSGSKFSCKNPLKVVISKK